MNLLKIILISLFFFLLCGSNTEKENGNALPENTNDKSVKISDLTDSCIVDGFDYPVGNSDGKGSYTSKLDGKTYDSWYNSTKFAEVYKLGIHTGIDLNGTGGGNTDSGQPVYSIARGWIVEAKNFGPPWGNVILVKHTYLENGKINCCFSLYAHLEDLQITKGDFIERSMLLGYIGTGGGSYPAHVHLEIRKEKMAGYYVTYWPSSNSKDIGWVRDFYEDPEIFINNHRSCTCPIKENEIILAIKNQYTMYYYEKGKLKNKYEIALSQNPLGHKERQGDLKLPEGEYYILEKQKGPFSGSFSEYLGNRLLRISYPNTFDAINGFNNGLITKKERDAIISAGNTMAIPPCNTNLGGKIVIHGWNGDWIADGKQNLTWGCICMHNRDIEKFYEKIKIKTKIIISP